MGAGRRPHLAKRRKTLGFSQEALAAELGADRSTIARWERGECDPQPYHRAKLCEILRTTPDKLDELLTLEPAREWEPASPVPSKPLQGRVIDHAVATPLAGFDELEDMNRRELLRLLSVAGTLVTVPNLVTDAYADDPEQLDQYERLNSHLWQVYALSESKRTVYPVVRRQLDLVTDGLRRAHSSAANKRLCGLTGDLLQLAGEFSLMPIGTPMPRTATSWPLTRARRATRSTCGRAHSPVTPTSACTSGDSMT